MGSTTILRGFKVSIPTLDNFLRSNGVEETFGIPPFYQDHPDEDKISKLLHRKLQEAGGTTGKNNFRVMIPSDRGHSPSTLAYVTYAWVTFLSQREIRLAEDLPEEIPKGFEELRADVLSHKPSGQGARGAMDEGKLRVYGVTTHDIRGLYIPQESDDRLMVSKVRFLSRVLLQLM